MSGYATEARHCVIITLVLLSHSFTSMLLQVLTQGSCRQSTQTVQQVVLLMGVCWIQPLAVTDASSAKAHCSSTTTMAAVNAGLGTIALQIHVLFARKACSVLEAAMKDLAHQLRAVVGLT